MKYPTHLLKLVEGLRRLPGVGTRTAERFAFRMIDWEGSHLQELAHLLATLQEKLTFCSECGCLNDDDRCTFCENPTRDVQMLCVLASAKDVFSIEQTGEYRGIYHVLGGLLSPMDGRGPEQLNLGALRRRVLEHGVKEVVIGLDSTLEGDATALHIKRELEGTGVSISRFAFGLPMGSALEYVDEGTLALAMSGRRGF